MKKSLTKNKQYIRINSWVVKKITIYIIHTRINYLINKNSYTK